MENKVNEEVVDQLFTLYIEKRDKSLEAFSGFRESRKSGIPKDMVDEAYKKWKQLAFELDVAAEALNIAFSRVMNIDADTQSKLNAASERVIKSRIAIEDIYESSR